MKRILYFLFCALCLSTAAQAQELYCIHQFAGTVEYKRALTKDPWQPVVKGTELRSIDSLRLAPGASVRVMNMVSRHVYPYEKQGKTNIYYLIQAAKDADSERIKDGLITDISSGKTVKRNIHDMKMVGAAIRGGVHSGDSLRQMAQMLAWIGAQACSGQPSPVVPGLTFKKISAFDEYDFICENNTDKNYFTNVLHINKLTGRVSLCYVTTYKGSGSTVCPIVPAGFCQCGTDIYFPASKNDVYVMIATEIEFDTDVMDRELARHPIDKAQNTHFDIKYIW